MEIPIDAFVDDSGWLGPDDVGDLPDAAYELVDEWEFGADAARWDPSTT